MTHPSIAETERPNRPGDWDEPSLDELLADEIMDRVTRSAHLDREQLRRQLSEIALRVHVKAAAQAD